MRRIEFLTPRILFPMLILSKFKATPPKLMKTGFHLRKANTFL